jgi:antitoxin (DNA-binding transcriptional repressor) of toxin-antitoxin stability system
MTTSMTLEAAQLQLPSLIHNLGVGSEVEITENGVAVAKIVPVTAKPRRVLGAQRGSVLSMEQFDDPIEEIEKQPRVAGSAKDRILWMAEDFNAPLDDFEEDGE